MQGAPVLTGSEPPFGRCLSGAVCGAAPPLCPTMEAKLCRLCGRPGLDYASIFRTEGLPHRLETCLPITVSRHSLLPDTICPQCCENIDTFYTFTKSCLESILVLEKHLDINESCLRAKRRTDKSTTTEGAPPPETHECQVQTEDTDDAYIDALLLASEAHFKPQVSLVEYAIDSDSASEVDEGPKHSLIDRLLHSNRTSFGKKYFDDPENYLINEISQRKIQKRQHSEEREDDGRQAKFLKLDSTNRRKSSQPKRWLVNPMASSSPMRMQPMSDLDLDHGLLPQVCFLCEEQITGPSMFASHVFEAHGIDMANVVAENGHDKKKKLPNLLKISDLRKSDSFDDTLPIMEASQSDDPPTLLPNFVCSLCPAMFTSRPDLFTHLRVKHPDHSTLLCGMCLHNATTPTTLQSHIDQCALHHPPTTRYLCHICRYGDDNPKLLENHILVHTFLLDHCKKHSKIFDPADYIDLNDTNENTLKTLSCSECGLDHFDTFKEFSTHRRSQHSIFHCDLCNKFYGRNSHLWKHVNRLHKGHPSITCQLCYKTSASKYHLAQHFNKIHSAKQCKQRALSHNSENNSDDFMSQKFQAFDFQSVKQSFMRQEMLEQERKVNNGSEIDDNSNTRLSDQDDKKDSNQAAPKEIDTSSHLYTNIITNYTPPVNEGEFKCPKCEKGFHKKNLLKKHKKNCRPRLQKDLLTRCKSCARIFKDRQSLAKHLVNYHSEYACEICQQKVQSKCEIVSHIRFSHPGCHLVCKLCGNILRSRADLLEHTRDHYNSYVCQFCGDPLQSKIKLKMHILSLHRKILSLSCGICLKLFETQHVLREHVRLVHGDQLAPLTSCPVCGKNYGSKWKTYDHINKSHGRIFKACKACLEVFDTEEQLQVHYENAHGTMVKPSAVKVKSESDHDLSSDEENDDDDNEPVSLLEKTLLGKKLPYEEAPKVRNEEGLSQNSSKRTVYVNSNDPSFCEICLKTWPAKKHLWQHYIRCHKSVAATVCGICLQTNTSYSALQTHLQLTHPTLLHGQGFGSNFICRICGRYHNASSKLKLHMAIHENFDWGLLDGSTKEIKAENGYEEDDDEEDINYESLIEQVECSSGDESDVKEGSSSDDEDDDDSDSLGSKRNEPSSDESSASSFSIKSEASSDSNVVSSEGADKMEELDEAVQSIHYEYVDKVDDEDDDDEYGELPAPNLNDNEIESAVGSIL